MESHRVIAQPQGLEIIFSNINYKEKEVSNKKNRFFGLPYIFIYLLLLLCKTVCDNIITDKLTNKQHLWKN